MLIDSLGTDAANRKTLELAAETGAEQDELTPAFAALQPDAADGLDGVADGTIVPMSSEPERFQQHLRRIGGEHQ